MRRDYFRRTQWRCASRLATNLALTPGQRTLWKRANVAVAVFLPIAAVSLMAIALWTNWDLRLADSAFDPIARVFPLRNAWLTATFNHVILKRIFTALGLVVMLAVLWDLYAPRDWGWLRRFQLRVIALSALLVPLAVRFLKQVSDSHCPWDLQRYGGSEPYIRLFEYFPHGASAGHCMPAGHASSALWMISFFVLFIPYRLLHAALVLAFFLIFGIGVGWMQQLRGAHFLTHTLWSAWTAVLLVFLVTICLDRWPARQPEKI